MLRILRCTYLQKVNATPIEWTSVITLLPSVVPQSAEEALSFSYLPLWFWPCLALSLCLACQIFKLLGASFSFITDYSSQTSCLRKTLSKWGRNLWTRSALSSGLLPEALWCCSADSLLRLPQASFAPLFMWSRAAACTMHLLVVVVLSVPLYLYFRGTAPWQQGLLIQAGMSHARADICEVPARWGEWTALAQSHYKQTMWNCNFPADDTAK